MRNAIAGIPGVEAVHDLHVWTISSGLVSLSAHVLIRDDRVAQAVLDEARTTLAQRFGLTHTTLQIEGVRCEGDRCWF